MMSQLQPISYGWKKRKSAMSESVLVDVFDERHVGNAIDSQHEIMDGFLEVEEKFEKFEKPWFERDEDDLSRYSADQEILEEELEDHEHFEHDTQVSSIGDQTEQIDEEEVVRLSDVAESENGVVSLPHPKSKKRSNKQIQRILVLRSLRARGEMIIEPGRWHNPDGSKIPRPKKGCPGHDGYPDGYVHATKGGNRPLLPKNGRDGGSKTPPSDTRPPVLQPVHQLTLFQQALRDDPELVMTVCLIDESEFHDYRIVEYQGMQTIRHFVNADGSVFVDFNVIDLSLSRSPLHQDVGWAYFVRVTRGERIFDTPVRKDSFEAYTDLRTVIEMLLVISGIETNPGMTYSQTAVKKDYVPKMVNGSPDICAWDGKVCPGLVRGTRKHRTVRCPACSRQLFECGRSYKEGREWLADGNHPVATAVEDVVPPHLVWRPRNVASASSPATSASPPAHMPAPPSANVNLAPHVRPLASSGTSSALSGSSVAPSGGRYSSAASNASSSSSVAPAVNNHVVIDVSDVKHSGIDVNPSVVVDIANVNYSCELPGWDPKVEGPGYCPASALKQPFGSLQRGDGGHVLSRDEINLILCHLADLPSWCYALFNGVEESVNVFHCEDGKRVAQNLRLEKGPEYLEFRFLHLSREMIATIRNIQLFKSVVCPALVTILFLTVICLICYVFVDVGITWLTLTNMATVLFVVWLVVVVKNYLYDAAPVSVRRQYVYCPYLLASTLSEIPVGTDYGQALALADVIIRRSGNIAIPPKWYFPCARFTAEAAAMLALSGNFPEFGESREL